MRRVQFRRQGESGFPVRRPDIPGRLDRFERRRGAAVRRVGAESLLVEIQQLELRRQMLASAMAYSAEESAALLEHLMSEGLPAGRAACEHVLGRGDGVAMPLRRIGYELAVARDCVRYWKEEGLPRLESSNDARLRALAATSIDVDQFLAGVESAFLEVEPLVWGAPFAPATHHGLDLGAYARLTASDAADYKLPAPQHPVLRPLGSEMAAARARMLAADVPGAFESSGRDRFFVSVGRARHRRRALIPRRAALNDGCVAMGVTPTLNGMLDAKRTLEEDIRHLTQSLVNNERFPLHCVASLCSTIVDPATAEVAVVAWTSTWAPHRSENEADAAVVRLFRALGATRLSLRTGRSAMLRAEMLARALEAADALSDGRAAHGEP